VSSTSPPTAKYHVNKLFPLNYNMQYFGGGGQSPPTTKYPVNKLFPLNYNMPASNSKVLKEFIIYIMYRM
jgi:hypothetical protein